MIIIFLCDDQEHTRKEGGTVGWELPQVNKEDLALTVDATVDESSLSPGYEARRRVYHCRHLQPVAFYTVSVLFICRLRFS
uniref:Uncharacterized protein n=1 Tax=Hyaloperonospora arabidopsidis (strain Emoy2) TaxID=559515 RepID=M4B1E4_HYAAE